MNKLKDNYKDIIVVHKEGFSDFTNEYVSGNHTFYQSIIRYELFPQQPIFIEYNLNFIPFQHEDIDRWRNSLSGGISYIDEETNLIIQGGVDDVWYNIDTKELVVADYKAQSTTAEVEKEYYLKSQYHQGYKTQMDIYVYILRKMNFKVSSTSYFMVCNGVKTKDKFDANMEFDITLVDYETDTSWVQNKINDMKLTLDSNTIPEITPHCENCAYINKGSEFN